MKQKKAQNSKKLREQAITIASEIFQLTGQYTNDSATSKFFLPDELNSAFYVAAGGFSTVIYEPQLKAEEVAYTQSLSLFLVLETYGFQIYLKERAIRTNYAPYRIPTDEDRIKEAATLVLDKAEKGNLISSPLTDEIVKIVVEHLHATLSMNKLKLAEHILNDEKFYSYMVTAVYFGYNLAALLLYS